MVHLRLQSARPRVGTALQEAISQGALAGVMSDRMIEDRMIEDRMIEDSMIEDRLIVDSWTNER